MFRMEKVDGELFLSENGPRYVCWAQVAVMDNRKNDAQTENMSMYFEIDSVDIEKAKIIMKTIIREIGYSYCGIIGELVIREYFPDMSEMFVHGKDVTA